MTAHRRLTVILATTVAIVIAAVVVVLSTTGGNQAAGPLAPVEMPGLSFVTSGPGGCCRVALEKVSRDPYNNPQNQHEGAVEPTLARFGRTLVVVYQVARQNVGGASQLIGFAVSHDTGRTWTSGFLPGITVRSQPAGRYRSASDPAVAYDRRHRTWLAVSYAIAANTLPFATLLVNRSADGLTWQTPRELLSRSELISVDKPWVTCDDHPQSEHYGTCYAAYNEAAAGIAVQRTTDGGIRWSPPVVAARTDLVGAIPYVQADGTLLVVFRERGRISVTSSGDAGRTFSAATAIGPERLTTDEESGGDPYPMRAPAIPTVNADSADTVYVAWPECSGSSGCHSTGILLSSSRDGRTWSGPVTAVAPRPGTYALLPAIAADSGRTASAGRLALVYYRLRPTMRSVEPLLAQSHDAGSTWTTTPLSPGPEQLDWLAQAGSIPFAGDYVGVTLEDSTVVAAVTVTRKPRGRHLRQGIYVARSR